MLSDFTDWIGISADVPATYQNNGWKTWKKEAGSKHPSA